MKQINFRFLALALALVAAFGFLFTSPIQAQSCTETNTVLAGKVTRYKKGRDGITRIEPVEGIAIKAVHRVNLYTMATAITDSTGNYVLEGLEPCSTYNVLFDPYNTPNYVYAASTNGYAYTDPGVLIGDTASNPFLLYFRIYEH